jgi:hypothetical protein
MPSWHSMLSKVSAVPESTSSISPARSATWLSDVGSSAHGSTSSQSPPCLSATCRSTAVTGEACACLLQIASWICFSTLSSEGVTETVLLMFVEKSRLGHVSLAVARPIANSRMNTGACLKMRSPDAGVGSKENTWAARSRSKVGAPSACRCHQTCGKLRVTVSTMPQSECAPVL